MSKTLRGKIECWRREAKKNRDQALFNLSKQYYRGRIDVLEEVLASLDVLAEEEGWLNEVDVEEMQKPDSFPWVACASLQQEPDPENSFTVPITILILRRKVSDD